MLFGVRLTIPVLGLLWAAGCATVVGNPTNENGNKDRVAAVPGAPAGTAMGVDIRLPLATDAEGPLLVSRMDVRAGERLLAYQASYAIDSGDMLHSLADEGQELEKIPMDLATQSIEQQLHSVVPMPLGGPVRLEYRSRQESRIAVGGDRFRQTASARLEWATGPIGLNVEWQPPRANPDPGNPVDCTVAGVVRMPMPTVLPGAAFELAQRGCRLAAPLPGVDRADLQIRGVAWRWGPDSDNALGIEIFDPQLPGQRAEGGSDYEIRLSQRLLQFLGWQTSTNLALRHAGSGPVSGSQSATFWAANLKLRRQLPLFDVSAQWAQTQDPLWFLASSMPVSLEQLRVALNFDDWLAAWLPNSRPDMDVSWQRRESRTGEIDTSVNVQLQMTW